MSKRYRPANGIEGEWFAERWCNCCQRDANDDCGIRTATFALPIDHPDYPEEWQWGPKRPLCTAWEPLEEDT